MAYQGSFSSSSSCVCRGQREEQAVCILPPGFRFCPSSEELALHYVRVKNDGFEPPISIPEMDIYNRHPKTLSGNFKYAVVANEKYYFTQLKMMTPGGKRVKRSTDEGYWKDTSIGNGELTKDGKKIGYKKTFVFIEIKDKKKIKTNWIMHEFGSTSTDMNDATPTERKKIDNYVLCKIYESTRSHSSNNLTEAIEEEEIVRTGPIQQNLPDINDSESMVIQGESIVDPTATVPHPNQMMNSMDENNDMMDGYVLTCSHSSSNLTEAIEEEKEVKTGLIPHSIPKHTSLQQTLLNINELEGMVVQEGSMNLPNINDLEAMVVQEGSMNLPNINDLEAMVVQEGSMNLPNINDLEAMVVQEGSMNLPNKYNLESMACDCATFQSSTDLIVIVPHSNQENSIDGNSEWTSWCSELYDSTPTSNSGAMVDFSEEFMDEDLTKYIDNSSINSLWNYIQF